MKTCCDEHCANHGCNQGRDCPVRETPKAPMVDGGNFWYQPEAESMTFADRILLAVIFAACFGVVYGALRYYGAMAFGWPI